MIDDAFFSAVEPLRVPEMGTDSVAPMLYWLLRMIRPRRVLEVGSGYTTPFLALALRDNVEAVAREREWLRRAPEKIPLGHAAFYEHPYEPTLVTVDRLQDPTSSAPRVRELLEDLSLAPYCRPIEADLSDSVDEVRTALGQIDLAWVDTWDTLAFVRHYWESIDPAGGLLAIHWLMTYPQGRAVLRYIESFRTIEGGRLEIVNLVEPHRVAQNSLTLVRRTRDYRDPEDLRPDGTRNDPKGTLGA